jgi:8-oxo-dGTP pyrophosphatase MutT (NUDIX family)
MTKSRVAANLGAMIREISSGGVVVRREGEEWQVAVIEPRKDTGGASAGTGANPAKRVWALPKGLVDAGENAQETAIREVREETGIEALSIAKLTDIKYVYVRTWGDQQRVFKIVSFYLLKYQSGRIDDISPEMRIEVRQALWLPMADAVKKLSYSSERKVVRMAQEYLNNHQHL